MILRFSLFFIVFYRMFNCSYYFASSQGRAYENTGQLRLVVPRHFLLKCLYQDRKERGHVFFRRYRLGLFLRLFYFTLEMFRQCDMFLFFILLYSETCLNRTMNRLKSCINRTLGKVLKQEIFDNFTCTNRTPVYSEHKNWSQ